TNQLAGRRYPRRFLPPLARQPPETAAAQYAAAGSRPHAPARFVAGGRLPAEGPPEVSTYSSKPSASTGSASSGTSYSEASCSLETAGQGRPHPSQAEERPARCASCGASLVPLADLLRPAARPRRHFLQDCFHSVPSAIRSLFL